MGNVQYTPRWLHRRLTIDSSSTYERPISTSFANEEIWNWHIQYLAVTGVVEADASGGTYYFDDVLGGVARRLQWNIGYSQKGDVSLDLLSTDALMGCNWRQRQSYSWFDPGLRFDFPTPFPLPPDSGINVEFRYELKDDPDGTRLGANFPGIVLNGYRRRADGQKVPAQLAGFFDGVPGKGVGVMFQGSDLWNNGETDLMITEMMLQAGQITPYFTTADGITVKPPQFNSWLWRINPSTGTPWMPRSDLIPAGNIAPFNRGMNDWDDQGPRVYSFPPETILKPKQRVGMKIRNISSTDQTIDVSVFGMLEVR